MALIKKIKLPNNQVRDIGALSSNIIYDGDTGIIVTFSITPVYLTTDEDYNKFEINIGSIETFTYGAKVSIVSNLNITSGVFTLGSTSINEQQLIQLLQLLD